jgi:hypothetical protein
MYPSRFLPLIAGALALLATGAQARAQEPPPAPEPGIDVQARGPIHEAYAQPTDLNPQPGPVVPKQPPDPVPEQPPDQKPEGDNVQWIPGYWAWDSENSDFLWVSGCWRVPPPGRRWVPGHWTQVDTGWQWAPGLWAPAGQQELAYQPDPPQSLDVGPSSPPPNDDTEYVPGYWNYTDSSYAWRPGFWTAAQPGWVWCPSRYAWTPGGSVFVSGYWDYPLEDRGMLFAPVVFQRPWWRTAGWFYRPRFCLNLGGLLGSLFCRPRYCSYYFGDYYAPGYLRLGFQPWCLYGPRRYDALFTYYRWWNHRRFPGWYAGLRDVYFGRRDGRFLRPPRTFVAQTALFREWHFDQRTWSSLHTVTTLHEWQRTHGSLTSVGVAQRTRFREMDRQFRQVQLDRARVERPVGRPAVGRPAPAHGGVAAGAVRPFPGEGVNTRHGAPTVFNGSGQQVHRSGYGPGFGGPGAVRPPDTASRRVPAARVQSPASGRAMTPSPQHRAAVQPAPAHVSRGSLLPSGTSRHPHAPAAAPRHQASPHPKPPPAPRHSAPPAHGKSAPAAHGGSSQSHKH